MLYPQYSPVVSHITILTHTPSQVRRLLNSGTIDQVECCFILFVVISILATTAELGRILIYKWKDYFIPQSKKYLGYAKIKKHYSLGYFLSVWAVPVQSEIFPKRSLLLKG